MIKFTNKYYATCNVVIGNLDWEIILTDDYCEKLYDEGENLKKLSLSDVAMGMCYKPDCQIFVSKNMSKKNLRRTIMHELTHAVIYTYGSMVSKDSLDEEEICNFMEIHLDEIQKLTDEAFKKLGPEYDKIK